MESCSAEFEDWVVVDAKDITADADLLGNSCYKNHSSGFSVWTLWVLGSAISFSIPLYRRILSTEEVVEKAAETTVEAVEKVSEVTEKIASEIADELPDGGRLKEEALQIKKICGTLDSDAKTTEAFIDKVDHIKEEVDAIAEPIIEKAEEIENEIQEQESSLNPGPAVDQPKAA